MVKYRRPCIDGCRRTARITAEEGSLIKMKIIQTFEEDDEEIVSGYKQFHRLGWWS